MDVAAIKLNLIPWLAEIQDEALLKKSRSISSTGFQNLDTYVQLRDTFMLLRPQST